MAQVAFFANGVSPAVGSGGILLAWDRYNRGPSAADDIDTTGCGLYSWFFLLTNAQLMILKTGSPIPIPEENCPETPDGFPLDYFNRFEVKPGGTALGNIVDFSFEIFDGSTRIYGVAPVGQTLKVELTYNSFIYNPLSIQERPTLQAWEDPLEGWASLLNSGIHLPAKELWRALMTPNQPLDYP